ncbi:MAG: hypothetical protein V4667_04390 [Bacteroidota bacterium]
MKNLVFIISLLSLFISSCKKEEVKQDPYAWIDNYTGNFKFSISEESFQPGDPFGGFFQSTTSTKNYEAEGTISRINEKNLIKIQIGGFMIDSLIIDENKNFSYTFNDGGQCGGNTEEITGMYVINRDSVSFSYISYYYRCDGMRNHFKKNAVGTRLP